jgi:uncharacterized protein (DUF362 family)
MAAAGGTMLLAPLLEACARPEVTPVAAAPTVAPDLISPTPTAAGVPISPTPTAAQNPTTTPYPNPTTTASTTTKIALVKTGDRADGVRRAIDLLGVNPVRGNHVLLKPNFNSADAAPGSTHPDVLRSLVVRLNDMGARAISLADRSGMGDTRAVMRQQGVFDLATELGFATVVLDELAERDWVIRESKEYHWPRGYAVPRMLLDAECVVQVCNLKTHRYGGHFTLSLKNSVGLAAKTLKGSAYDYMRELHGSPYQRLMIAEINTAYTPALIVMDGVEAFVDGGPDSGTKVKAGVVLAGTDRIAVDAVGVAILRLFGTTREVSRGKIFEQEQIARAVELGLGVESPAKIEIVTADADSEAYAGRITELLMQ